MSKKTLLIFVLLFIWGCSGTSTHIETQENIVDVVSVNQSISTGVISISESAGVIKDNSDDILVETQLLPASPEKNTISSKAKEIKTEANKIEVANQEIKTYNSHLLLANKEISRYVEQNKELQVRLEKSESQLKDATYQRMQWLIFFSVISLGVSGALVITGSKFGIFGIISSGIVIAVAQAVSTFSHLLSLVGGIVVILIVAGCFWYIFVNRKSFIECVKSVEVIQENITKKEKEKIFGKPGDNGLMKDVQSKTTESNIKKEKNKLNKSKTVKTS